MTTKLACGRGGVAKMEDAKQILDITVLMGGPSSEREVSLVSGGAIANALRHRGHKVTQADINPSDMAALERNGIDVVFVALHGLFGESGQVQQLCRDHHLRYTGSPPTASQNAMDKDITKTLARKVGISTADWVVVRPGQSADSYRSIGLPAVVKPVDGGSSIDITIARDQQTLDAAVQDVVAKYGVAMVEQFIKGREMTVGILGDRALPVLEIVPTREFYDYTAKYADDAGTRYTFDHGLSHAVVDRMSSDALTLFHTLGCRDMSRVDFLVAPDGQSYMLEINTIPGFTSHSLLPMAAARTGISFDEMVDSIARMAMRRLPGD